MTAPLTAIVLSFIVTPCGFVIRDEETGTSLEKRKPIILEQFCAFYRQILFVNRIKKYIMCQS